jgi:hypothetical protein
MSDSQGGDTVGAGQSSGEEWGTCSLVFSSVADEDDEDDGSTSLQQLPGEGKRRKAGGGSCSVHFECSDVRASCAAVCQLDASCPVPSCPVPSCQAAGARP